ncbi:MAG TPA: hypothetical protein VMR50_06830 [Myxococcota bacterium]|nr:hypothetical protein [Myxococcota bacterium]
MRESRERGTRAVSFAELNVKATCFDLTSKGGVGKAVQSKNDFVAQVLDRLPEDAKQYQFVIDSQFTEISVVRTCDGATQLTFAMPMNCNTGAINDHLVRICYEPLSGAWISATVDGALLCTLQEKLDSHSNPSAMKAACSGSFHTSGDQFCEFEATGGKLFVPKGNCP